MAYSQANMNCAVVGPQKLWIYKTTDTLNSVTILTYFTDDVPGLAAGDFMIIKTADQVDLLAITAIDSASAVFQRTLAAAASSLA
ncbi:MAG: hypothetical protein IMZ61_15475 [Planctomycetes bacterium]|nr:hypothetical protein [Candidatus Atribacteria bacterium]MBE3145298.1 hypothetical protein [Planctomycetota bacterium]